MALTCDEHVGKTVRVKSCSAFMHDRYKGCVCHLRGKTLRITYNLGTTLAGARHRFGKWHIVQIVDVVLVTSRFERLRDWIDWLRGPIFGWS